MMVSFSVTSCWPILAWLATVAANTLPAPQDCEMARAKCGYRGSCYKSLHAYMVGCADVLTGRTTRCTFACQRALISLTSTEYGLALSTCDCGENEFCKKTKERIEVCRPEVSYATAEKTIVSCSVAKWICAADTLCSTALDFYHRLCRPMFHGRKCTPRCNNSLAILDRQEKAAKLRDCYCDGSEDFPCHDMKRNTEMLCYGREWHSPFEVTTPKSGTGQCVAGRWVCVCAGVLMAVVAWRTSGGGGTETSGGVWDDDGGGLETSGGTRSVKRDGCRPLKVVTGRSGQWPWWWRSEGAA